MVHRGKTHDVEERRRRTKSDGHHGIHSRFQSKPFWIAIPMLFLFLSVFLCVRFFRFNVHCFCINCLCIYCLFISLFVYFLFVCTLYIHCLFLCVCVHVLARVCACVSISRRLYMFLSPKRLMTDDGSSPNPGLRIYSPLRGAAPTMEPLVSYWRLRVQESRRSIQSAPKLHA